MRHVLAPWPNLLAETLNVLVAVAAGRHAAVRDADTVRAAHERLDEEAS